jgi:hypothetical protein
MSQVMPELVVDFLSDRVPLAHRELRLHGDIGLDT